MVGLEGATPLHIRDGLTGDVAHLRGVIVGPQRALAVAQRTIAVGDELGGVVDFDPYGAAMARGFDHHDDDTRISPHWRVPQGPRAARRGAVRDTLAARMPDR